MAGPYRANSWNGVWDNVMHSRAEARKLWMQGWAVICPHANSIFMDGAEGETDGVFLKGDIEILKRCDAIYMLKGFRSSVGAVEEYNAAQKYGLEILYEDSLDAC